MSQGPLAGVRVIEVAGIGPGPFCAMMLADMGAEVLRVDRTGAADLGLPIDPKFSVLNRGRRSVALDLKTPAAVAAMKRLIAGADALIEGFRPGVMERLGLGPDDCLAVNPRLVYGRMTGWGQDRDRACSMEAGFDDHLVKPVDPGGLLERLANSMAGSRGHDRAGVASR